jgi:predicted transcriptional regulator
MTERITLRLPDDLHQQLVELAKLDDRSLNAEIVRAVRHYLSMRQQNTGEADTAEINPV